MIHDCINKCNNAFKYCTVHVCCWLIPGILRAGHAVGALYPSPIFLLLMVSLRTGVMCKKGVSDNFALNVKFPEIRSSLAYRLVITYVTNVDPYYCFCFFFFLGGGREGG